MKFIIIFTILCAAVLCQTPSPKSWSAKWRASFTEKISMPMRGEDSYTGQFYFDWTTKRFRVDRNNGNLDRYCGLTKPFTNTPCNQFVHTDGWRYLHFPKEKWCCKCCHASNGCGIVKPDWFKSGEYVVSEKQVGGTDVQTWNVQGLQKNIYAQTVQGGRPKRIYQEPQSDMIFDHTSYTENFDSSVFDLPAGCDKMCPTFSICSVVRAKYHM